MLRLWLESSLILLLRGIRDWLRLDRHVLHLVLLDRSLLSQVWKALNILLLELAESIILLLLLMRQEEPSINEPLIIDCLIGENGFTKTFEALL